MRLKIKNDFTISNGLAKIITAGDFTSYTLQITRIQPTLEYFENLVIQQDANYNIRVAIVKYYPTTIASETTHKSFSFEGRINITNIPLAVTSPYTNFSRGCTYEVVMCNYGGSEHVAGSCCETTYIKVF